MRVVISALVILGSMLVLSACTDAFEERGLCSYFGACEYGLGTDLDTIDYSKELGSHSAPGDPTEYTVSGKHSGGKLGSAASGGGGSSPDAATSGDDGAE